MWLLGPPLLRVNGKENGNCHIIGLYGGYIGVKGVVFRVLRTPTKD